MMALDCFSSDQIKKISQASFELGRLHGQEDLMVQYKRCGTLRGLTEIDFQSQKQDWKSELDSGIYKYIFRIVGGTYFVHLERNNTVQGWVENSVPDCMYVQTPSTPISPPSPATLLDHNLSQSVSGVSIHDYPDSLTSSQEDDVPTITKGDKRVPSQIIGGMFKRVKFDVQPPGAYPWDRSRPSGSRAPVNTSAYSLGPVDNARTFEQVRTLHSSSIAKCFDWNIDPGILPFTILLCWFWV